MRLLRSYLFAPGNDERLLARVFTAGADAVVLDLEDAVPESEKARARACVHAAVQRQTGESKGRPPAYVRVNPLTSSHWRADIDAVLIPGVSGIRVPKAEDLESICRLNDAITDRERALGLAHDSVVVVATIESARGVANLAQIVRGPRVVGLAFGAADFCADVGADATDGAASLLARSALVAASGWRRLSPPVASVFTRFNDDEGLRADTLGQKRLGFFGRSAIHPRQVPIIHEVFDPTPAEAEEARGVIGMFEAAVASGRGVTHTEGSFVDLAVVRRARSLLDLLQRVGSSSRGGNRR